MGTTLILISISFHSCAKTQEFKSYQFDIYSFEWSPYGTSGTSDYCYIAAHNIAAITQDVLDNDTVLGYVGTSSGWFALPFTFTNSGYSTNLNYCYVVGGVGLASKDTDLLSTAPSSTTTFKMIVVTQKDMHLLEGIDKTNYEEVSRTLGL